MRYIIAKDSNILQILYSQPLFTSKDAIVLTYDGDEPDSELIIQDGVVRTKNSISKTLEQHKVDCTKQIDDMVNTVRSSHVYNIFGQMYVQQEQTQQAIDYISNVQPTPNMIYFPYVQLEAEINNCSIEEAANNIIARHKVWNSIVFQTEKIRLLHQNEILKTETKSDADKVTTNSLNTLLTLLK
jgi:hypothetical protein